MLVILTSNKVESCLYVSLLNYYYRGYFWQHFMTALHTSKAAPQNDIPSKIIKTNSNIFSEFFLANFHNMIVRSAFPQQLKYFNLKPVL